MTLAELIPSLGAGVQSRMERGIWPAGSSVDAAGDLVLGGVRATELAARFGTPCYVLAEQDVRQRCRDYRAALPEADLAYAGKAMLSKGLLRWLAEEDMWLDVCSAGEIGLAAAVGFPAERMVLHGNVKTPEDWKAALDYRVGTVVLDSFDELDQLAGLASRPQQVMVRVLPGVDGHTFAAVTTGTEGQKFGFSLASGAAEEAVRRVLEAPNLTLAGLHCHIGSQISRVAGYEEAARRMIRLTARIRDRFRVLPPWLNLGGGQAVAYRESDPGFDLNGYATRLRVALAHECATHRVPLPRLMIEPGRSIVARAGVTLYRVAAVKHGQRTFVAVDGGMSDNPRPSLYDARYHVRLVGRAARGPRRCVDVVGRHCESGDVLARDVALPADVHAGDLLAVPCTGAYHHSLACSYNLVGRPPVVAVADGASRLLVRREVEEDLLARDLG